jgi:hypothetical protein
VPNVAFSTIRFVRSYATPIRARFRLRRRVIDLNFDGLVRDTVHLVENQDVIACRIDARAGAEPTPPEIGPEFQLVMSTQELLWKHAG